MKKTFMFFLKNIENCKKKRSSVKIDFSKKKEPIHLHKKYRG